MAERIRGLGVIVALIALVSTTVLLGTQNARLRTEVTRLRREARWPYVGQVVPNVVARTLAVDSITVGAADSGVRQVLFMFNTTCPICRENLPNWKGLYEEVRRDYSDRARVYAVSLHPEDLTRSYVEEHDLPFPVFLFPAPKLASLYHANAVPLTVVLNHRGEVLHVDMGLLEGRVALDSVIEAIRTPDRVVEANLVDSQ